MPDTPLQPVQPTTTTPIEKQPVSKTAAPEVPRTKSHGEQVAQDVVGALVERGLIKLDGVKDAGSIVKTDNITPPSTVQIPDLKKEAELKKTDKEASHRLSR